MGCTIPMTGVELAVEREGGDRFKSDISIIMVARFTSTLWQC